MTKLGWIVAMLVFVIIASLVSTVVIQQKTVKEMHITLKGTQAELIMAEYERDILSAYVKNLKAVEQKKEKKAKEYTVRMKYLIHCPDS